MALRDPSMWSKDRFSIIKTTICLWLSSPVGIVPSSPRLLINCCVDVSSPPSLVFTDLSIQGDYYRAGSKAP
ncbi:MAG TPA: hypothetical protein VFA76_04760 [Terriglobales bacterium]|nr:hypothetical protein [Terriglobales bacterium]